MRDPAKTLLDFLLDKKYVLHKVSVYNRMGEYCNRRKDMHRKVLWTSRDAMTPTQLNRFFRSRMKMYGEDEYFIVREARTKDKLYSVDEILRKYGFK